MSERAQRLLEAFLAEIGIDVNEHPEMKSTPQRFTDLLLDRFAAQPPLPTLEPIPSGSARGDCPMIVIRDIPFHSMCAHHIVPFFGKVHIAYAPKDHIAGFGAFGRLVDAVSRRPQLQEWLVEQVADAIVDDLRPRIVVVACEARQMCMELTADTGCGRTVVTTSRGVTWKDGWDIASSLVDRGSR